MSYAQSPYGPFYNSPQAPSNQQRTFDQDPALIATAVNLLRQAQAQGNSMSQIQTAMRKTKQNLERTSSASGAACSIVVYVLVVIVIVLAGLTIYRLINPSKYLSMPNISGVKPHEVEQLAGLLEGKKLDLRDFEVGYADSPVDKRDVVKINAVVESAYKFIAVAHTETSDKKMVFGVYINKKHLQTSFIFSLNHKTILPVDRAKMAWQINPRSGHGPKFGKSDLQFFIFNSGGFDSTSNLCYNYLCPPGINYGSDQANEYLAGSEVFTTLSFTVLVDNSSPDL